MGGADEARAHIHIMLSRDNLPTYAKYVAKALSQLSAVPLLFVIIAAFVLGPTTDVAAFTLYYVLATGSAILVIVPLIGFPIMAWLVLSYLPEYVFGTMTTAPDTAPLLFRAIQFIALGPALVIYLIITAAVVVYLWARWS